MSTGGCKRTLPIITKITGVRGSRVNDNDENKENSCQATVLSSDTSCVSKNEPIAFVRSPRHHVPTINRRRAMKVDPRERRPNEAVPTFSSCGRSEPRSLGPFPRVQATRVPSAASDICWVSSPDLFKQKKSLLYILTPITYPPTMSDPEHPPDISKEAADHVQHVGKSPITAGKLATQQQMMAALTATDVTIRRLDL